MEQVTRRGLFGLAVGALALPAVKLLPDKVLPTAPSTKVSNPTPLMKIGDWKEVKGAYRCVYEPRTGEVRDAARAA